MWGGFNWISLIYCIISIINFMANTCVIYYIYKLLFFYCDVIWGSLMCLKYRILQALIFWKSKWLNNLMKNNTIIIYIEIKTNLIKRIQS